MNTFNKTLSRVTLVLGVTFMSAFQLYADDWKEIMYADPTIFVEIHRSRSSNRIWQK